MLASSPAAGDLLQQNVPRGKMSRVSVGNLINHTTQSTGGPVGVHQPQAPALPPLQPPPPQFDVYRYNEFGREYYAVREYYAEEGKIAYPFPCDEAEDESLDYLHILTHDIAFSKRLHHTDLRQRNRRARILDVGHGTGIWVYEMAEIAPYADVVGIDLHSRTPNRLEEDNIAPVPNASFRTPVDFLRPDWPFPLDSHDLIRMSKLCGSVPDWLSLYQTVTRYLQPGIGYVEHIEFDWTPRPMDGNNFPPAANELLQWWYDLQTASRMFGKPMDCPTHIDQLMQRCGLVDVLHQTVRVPLRFRQGDDREERLCGSFRHSTAFPFQDEHGRTQDDRIPRTFEGLSLSLFVRQLGMEEQAVKDLCARLRAIVLIPDLPIYFNLHVWTARRPRS